MKEVENMKKTIRLALLLAIFSFIGSFLNNCFGYFPQLPHIVRGYSITLFLLVIAFATYKIVTEHRIITFLLICFLMSLADIAGMLLGLFLRKDYSSYFEALYASLITAFVLTIIALIVMLVFVIPRLNKNLKET